MKALIEQRANQCLGVKLNCVLSVATTLLLFATGALAAPDPNFYIFLCFGQSNMESGGRMEDMDRTVDERFLVMADFDAPKRGWTRGNWYHAVPPLAAQGTGICLVDYFGRTMVANLPSNVRVGVIKVSVPGCKIELFQKDTFTNYVATAPSWMLNYVKNYGGNPYQYLVDLAKIAQKDGVIKGFLLHQGESNPNDHEWPNKVKGIYDNFIKDLDLKPEEVPFLAGETVNASDGYTMDTTLGEFTGAPEIDYHQAELPFGGRKPLPFVTVRLVRRFKTVPEMQYCGASIYDVTHGKSINTEMKTMGVTTTDANGNFSFNFIESDSTVVVKNVGLRCGGGEFGDYKDNATLYKYYIVEVVNPYYCSSLDEITADPGQTVDVSLSSLVRTWKLDVTVNDYSKGEPLYNLANVYVARPSKGTIPFTVPAEEGGWSSRLRSRPTSRPHRSSPPSQRPRRPSRSLSQRRSDACSTSGSCVLATPRSI